MRQSDIRRDHYLKKKNPKLMKNINPQNQMVQKQRRINKKKRSTYWKTKPKRKSETARE